MRNAMVIAGIFEFAGSFLMGSSVTSTIQSKICDPMAFQDEPAILMFGMLCVIVGVAAWLIIATLYALPVSTTHSCIGGLVGMTIVAKGVYAVKWSSVGGVVASWFISPVLSGIITCLIFWVVRKYVLRAKDSFNRAFHFYPLLIGITLFVLSLFMMLKGIPGLSSTLNPWLAALIALVFGGVCALILSFTVVPCLKRRIEAQRKADQEAMKPENAPVVIDVVKKEVELPVISDTPATETTEVKAAETTEVKAAETTEVKAAETVEAKEVEKPKEKNSVMHHNIHAELEDEQSVVYQLHQRAEKFDPYTERVFSYLQVITATLNSFAHGANDVANSIGPLASIVAIYKSGAVSESPDVDPWILALGGAGIVVGLACLGYKVMAAIGVNMVTVTSSRGFAIEVGSAFVIVAGSQLGLPLSTTHCQVGSTVGVGLMEGKNSVNWKLVWQVFFGWVITLLVCSITTGALFAFAVYAPTKAI